MLATDLPHSHLPGSGEGELERPLGARGEGVDLIPRILPELLKLTAHPIHVRAGPPEHLRRHVVAGDDAGQQVIRPDSSRPGRPGRSLRSEEHTSELQSRQYLVCRLLLEKKMKKNKYTHIPR